MYCINISNKGDYVFHVNSGGCEFIVGLKGITPPDTLLASLGACLGVYLRKYAESAKLDMPEFGISVKAEFSKESPFCFRKIEVAIDFKGAKFDRRRLKAMKAFIENCPVHKTLQQNPQVEIKLGQE